MDQRSGSRGLPPFFDDYGRNYKTGWSGCSTGEWHLHECAKALGEAAEYYSDSTTYGQQHPLEHLAQLTRSIAVNTLSFKLAQTFAVFAGHAWRLDDEQLLMLAGWSEELARTIQERK